MENTEKTRKVEIENISKFKRQKNSVFDELNLFSNSKAEFPCDLVSAFKVSQAEFIPEANQRAFFYDLTEVKFAFFKQALFLLSLLARTTETARD